MKRKNVTKWINKIITFLVFGIILLTAVTVIVSKASGGEPEIFGYQLKTVLSGSMEPAIQTGSIIAVKSVADAERSNLQKDDVITFMSDENILVTHRITEVTTTKSGVLYTTKGDNNDGSDRNPVLADNVVGVYSGVSIPYIGYLINFSQSPNGIIVFLILPGVLMLSYSAFNIWRVLSKLDDNKPADAE